MSVVTWSLPGPAATTTTIPISIIAANADATTFAISCTVEQCPFDSAQYTVGPWAQSGQGSGSFDVYFELPEAIEAGTGTAYITTSDPESMHCAISSGQPQGCTVSAALGGFATTTVESAGPDLTLGPNVFTITAGASLLSAAATASATGPASSGATGSSAATTSAAKTSSGSSSATSSAAGSTKTNAASAKGLTLSAVGVIGVFAAMLAL